MNNNLYTALQDAHYSLTVLKNTLDSVEVHEVAQMLDDDPDLANLFKETMSISRGFVGD